MTDKEPIDSDGIRANAFVWFVMNHKVEILDGMDFAAKDRLVLNLYLDWLLERV